MNDLTSSYQIHDRIYADIRAKGWPGWGGADRISKANILIGRLFAHPAVPQSGAVLDLGCGEGNYTRILYEKGYEVTGVDVSENAIAWAQEKSFQLGDSINYFVQDLSQPNALQGLSFDLIVDGNCFHCIIGEDRMTFLENVYASLHGGGIFFVSSMCSKNDKDEIREAFGQPYRHLRPVKSMFAEFDTVGFEILEHQIYERESFNHITIHARKNGKS